MMSRLSSIRWGRSGERSWASIVRQLRRPPVLVLVFMLLIAIFGPLFAPYDPLEPQPMNTLAAPSWAHWFGTDDYGFDIFSRVIYAARIDFSLALLGVLIGGGIGSLLGAFAAYRGGFIDWVLLRFVEIVQSFPVLLFALALFAAIGGGSRNMVLAIAIVNIPMYLRIIRSTLLPLRTAEFIDAARCAGLSGPGIVIKHFIPNAKGQIFSLFVLTCAYAIQIIAGLSFIGLGVEPPHPEWGSMINSGAGYIMLGVWWPSIFPGLAIVLSVYAVNGLSREQMTGQLRGSI
ncbi:MAG: peptide ABC transporter permease [Acidiferrobacteraceae bacterium]|nr:peptide ABC transporter permease [Acidiferrobacteraceae bacterium]